MPSLASLLSRVRVDPRLEGLSAWQIKQLLRGDRDRHPIGVEVAVPGDGVAQLELRRGERPTGRVDWHTRAGDLSLRSLPDDTSLGFRNEALEIEAAKRDWLRYLNPAARPFLPQPGWGVRGSYRVTF
jgi:hypothetical protein